MSEAKWECLSKVLWVVYELQRARRYRYQFTINSHHLPLTGPSMARVGMETFPSVAKSKQPAPVNHLRARLEMCVYSGCHRHKNNLSIEAQLLSHNCLFICVYGFGQVCMLLPVLVIPSTSTLPVFFRAVMTWLNALKK